MHLICQNEPGHPCALGREWLSEVREQPNFRWHAGLPPVLQRTAQLVRTPDQIFLDCRRTTPKRQAMNFLEKRTFLRCIVYILHGRCYCICAPK